MSYTQTHIYTGTTHTQYVLDVHTHKRPHLRERPSNMLIENWGEKERRSKSAPPPNPHVHEISASPRRRRRRRISRHRARVQTCGREGVVRRRILCTLFYFAVFSWGKQLILKGWMNVWMNGRMEGWKWINGLQIFKKNLLAP